MTNLSRTMALAMLLVAIVGGPTWAADATPATKAPVATKAPAAAPTPATVATKAPAAPTGAGSVALSDPATKAPPAGAVGETPPKPVPEADTQSWLKYSLAELMKLGFLILTIMLGAFVRVLMKKYGFSMYSEQVNDVLVRASGYGEQKALAASKLEHGKVTPGADKMKMAVGLAVGLAAQYKLPAKGEAWWEDQLEGWLGMKALADAPVSKPAAVEPEPETEG